jgi:adenylosuccinate lyase
VVHSQRILLELTRRGLDRQAAYVIVQRNAMRVFEEGMTFRDALLRDPEITRVMKPDEVSACFNTDYYTKHIDEIFRRVFG